MPIPEPTVYPTEDPETGALVDVDYWQLGQVADMFHMSLATARRRVKSGEWVVFQPLPGVFLMNAHQIAEAHAAMTGRVVPHTDLPDAPTRLGVPVDDTDLEGIR